MSSKRRRTREDKAADRAGQAKKCLSTMSKINLPRGAVPRLMLLARTNRSDEPRAALIRPRRMPVMFATLALAVDALRAEAIR